MSVINVHDSGILHWNEWILRSFIDFIGMCQLQRNSGQKIS